MKRSRRTFAMGSALAVLFLGLAMVGVPGAQAVTLGCGAVVSSNTTLDADVGPCNTGNGLIVQGSNFQLNLNGHKVFSNAPLPRNVGVDADGIWIPADVVGIKLLNATNVTVSNGSVERFNAGVSIERGGSNTIQNVNASNNQGPCIGENFSTFAIGSYGDGIVVFGSPNNRFINNTLRNNGPFSGIAIVAENTFITKAVPPYPSGSIIQGNLIEDNNICFADIGIRLEGPGASNTTVNGNTVRRSFQEGIVVHPVNVIDFSPLFQNPPQCQNRGFPSPSLPQCPIQNPLNPTNDNNVISNNVLEGNGFGGPEINAGPSRPNGVSLQTASGINLLSFCGYGADSNASGNTIQANTVTGTAGHGIQVGGCPLGQNPVNGTFPGFKNSRVTQNTSVNNNARHCGTLPPTPGCGSRPTAKKYDLIDTTHVITCPSTTASTQAQCATLGFPAPPASGPFVGTPVVQPGGTPCDNNLWWANRYGTATPPCTTAGGQQIASAAASGQASQAQASQAQASQAGQGAASANDYPLRGRR